MMEGERMSETRHSRFWLYAPFFALAIIALAGGAYWWFVPDFPELQRLSAKPCLCERKAGRANGCWSDYDRKVALVFPEQKTTPSDPVSVMIDCLDTPKGHECIARRTVNATGRPLCSDAEQQAFEAYWFAHMTEPDVDTRAYSVALEASKPKGR